VARYKKTTCVLRPHRQEHCAEPKRPVFVTTRLLKSVVEQYFDQMALDLGQNAYYLVYPTVKSTHLYSLAGNFLILQVPTLCRPLGSTD
jgi:hypothetical protein